MVISENVHTDIICIVHIVLLHVRYRWDVASRRIRQVTIISCSFLVGCILTVIILQTTASGRHSRQVASQSIAPNMTQAHPVAYLMGRCSSQVVIVHQNKTAVILVNCTKCFIADHHAISGWVFSTDRHARQAAALRKLGVAEQVVVGVCKFNRPHVHVFGRVPNGGRLDGPFQVISVGSILLDVYPVYTIGWVAVWVGSSWAKFNLDIGTGRVIVPPP